MGWTGDFVGILTGVGGTCVGGATGPCIGGATGRCIGGVNGTSTGADAGAFVGALVLIIVKRFYLIKRKISKR